MNNQNQQPLTKDELTYALKEERGELVKLIKQEISLPIGEKIDKMAGQIESIQTHQLKQDTRMDKMEESLKRKMKRKPLTACRIFKSKTIF